ncbi:MULTISPECIES: hypothetical protein [unclassified Micromonospora]|uniref:hypothetical protein n=1 Tax=unclassified Micromonospora TaxID=2617518 RepID=UPI002FEF3B2D
MTSNGKVQPALFLATTTGDGLDDPGLTFDGSDEAMRRLRHPFAVTPVRATAPRGADPDERD